MCAGCSRCPFLRHRTHAHAHGHAQLKMQPSRFQARKTSHLYAWSRDSRTAPCATMTWAACTVTSQKKQQTAASLELPTDALKQLRPFLQIVSDGPMSFSTSPAHLCLNKMQHEEAACRAVVLTNTVCPRLRYLLGRRHGNPHVYRSKTL